MDKSKLLNVILSLALVVTVAAFTFKRGVGGATSQVNVSLGLDRYNIFGGHRGMCWFEARGFFYVAQRNGALWLVDPLGCAFVSKGVNHISPYGDYAPTLGYSPYERMVRAKYGGFDSWLEATVVRLRGWGFNTIGSWSYEQLFTQMPYTLMLDVMASYGFDWVTGRVPDIFDPRFEEHARSVAAKKCAPRTHDPLLIGYFLDNELRWGPDWRSPRHLLDDFIRLPPDAPGKRAAAETLLEAFSGDLAQLSATLGVEIKSLDDLLRYTGDLPAGGLFDSARSLFLSRFTERYVSVAVRAVRSHDPNHLILGVRFAGPPPREVLEVVGKYVDVVTLNYYTYGNHEPPVGVLRWVHEVTGKPVMVTEFSYKAMDSGLPNTRGAGQPVRDQRERAYYTARYVLSIIELPFVVGYHWFQYTDQPAHGRFDGENSNFGLVTIDDEPWELLTSVFTFVNANVEGVHAGVLKADDLLRRVVELLKT